MNESIEYLLDEIARIEQETTDLATEFYEKDFPAIAERFTVATHHFQQAYSSIRVLIELSRSNEGNG